MGGVTGKEFLDKVFYITDGIMLAQVREITGIDGTTLQNWLKRGWVASPAKKAYSKEHLARILIINMLRDTMQLSQIIFLLTYVNGTEAQDMIIQSAAPADFTPDHVADQKIKKQGDGHLVLTLKQTPDVAAAVGKMKRDGQILIGFAAETHDVLENAQGKLIKKNLDMIVANDVTAPGAGFDVDTNIVTFVTKNGMETLPCLPKRQVADELLNRAMQLKK